MPSAKVIRPQLAEGDVIEISNKVGKLTGERTPILTGTSSLRACYGAQKSIRFK